MRRWLPAAAYDRPVTLFMAFVALMVIGLLAWWRVPLQLMPSGFEINQLWVWIPYPDGSPMETDEDVVRPIEAQLGTVSGIQQIRSRASRGSANLSITFSKGVDMTAAYNDVVDRLERALPDLPPEIERYGVFKYNPDDEPIVWTAVSIPSELDDPYFVLSRVVQPQLERLPGVAAVDLWGVPQRAVFIDYHRDKVLAHSVDLGALQSRLMTDNFQMSGGRVEDRGRELYVRSLARMEDVETLRRFPVKDGVTLADIADVELRSAYSADFNRVDGERGAVLAVKKESSGNTIDVGRAVAAALAELEADPRSEGVRFHVLFNQADFISDSLSTLGWTALTGGLFAIVILFSFLREWRMTLLIAASIPFSLLITIGVLYFRGDSLNVLSLMGLMLAVGMVVDNAIVVIETIYRRRAEGAGVRAAAVEGTAEVNLAILMSTLTTMVVFLPIILMTDDGNFSFFLGVIGFPVIFALGASLLVALAFAPLATRYMGHAQVKPDPRWLLWLGRRYRSALTWVLAHRADATAALIAVGLLTLVVPVRGVECSAEGRGNINDFVVRFTVPRQADIQRRYDIVRQMEDLVENHRTAWGVRVFRSRLSDGDYEGRMWVYLETDGPDREEVLASVRRRLPRDIPGVTASVGWEENARGGSDSLVVPILGEDMATLRELAEEVARRMRAHPEVLGAHVDSTTEGADEIHLVADREQLARYGVSARTVGQVLSYAMRGGTLGRLTLGEREVDLVSRFRLEDRDSMEVLGDFPIWSPSTGQSVPLRALTDQVVERGPGTIHRTNRRTSTQVTIDLGKDVTQSRARALLTASTRDMALPRGYAIGWEQMLATEEADNAAQLFALLLSVTFVFLLMGVLFESFILPLCVITTVPMAMFGAIWGLWLTNTPFDVMAGIGLVILVGVVVNNGIVLVDLITQLRDEGMERTEALLSACDRRMRPILMTALTTIFGLVPMAMGSSALVGIPYAPLGRTVIGGLAAATLLTLLFVPFLYALLDDLRTGSRRWIAWVRRVPSRPLPPAASTQ